MACAAVLDEFAITGRILGRDTDELEGYDWPLDGAHYGPGQRPRLPSGFHEPRGFDFNPQVLIGSRTAASGELPRRSPTSRSSRSNPR